MLLHCMLAVQVEVASANIVLCMTSPVFVRPQQVLFAVDNIANRVESVLRKLWSYLYGETKNQPTLWYLNVVKSEVLIYTVSIKVEYKLC